jgi:YD repeat-containing protein
LTKQKYSNIFGVILNYSSGTVSAGTEMMSQSSSLEEMIQSSAKPTRTPTAIPPASGFVPQFVSYQLPMPAFAPFQQSSAVTINYVYDPLYRLKEANYSTGDYYHYTYDAVGNRKTQTTSIGGMVSTTMSNYDHANRIIDTFR